MKPSIVWASVFMMLYELFAIRTHRCEPWTIHARKHDREEHPFYMMEFDHLDPDTKVRKVSALGGITSTLREIAKCEVVCANCHAARTYARLGKI